MLTARFPFISVFVYIACLFILFPSYSTFAKPPLPPLVVEGEILPDSITYFPQSYTSEVAFSPDGKTLATLHQNKIRLWDITSYRLLRTLTFNKNVSFKSLLNASNILSFSPDGKALASSYFDNASFYDDGEGLLLWDLEKGDEPKVLAGHTETVNAVSFSPDSKLLASGSDDKTIKLWDVESGNLLKTLIGHENIVNSVRFTPDNKSHILISSSKDNSVKFWDYQSELLASGSDDKTIKLWDVESGNLLKTLIGHENIVNSVRFTPDNKSHILISSSKDNSVKFWDYQSGQLLDNSWQKIDDVEIKTISEDGSKLATFSETKGITLWDTEKGNSLVSLAESTGKLTQFGFSPNGKMLIAVNSGKIKLWDTESGQLLKLPELLSDYVNSANFSTNSNLLAINYGSDGIALWDLATGRMITMLDEKIAGINSVSFSPDGKTVAVASAQAGENSIKLWDVAQGRLLRSLEGHSGYVNSVSFSPAGDLLASASADKTVNLWDTESGRLLKSLQHKDAVNSAIFSSDGKILVSSARESLKIWSVASGKILDSQDAERSNDKPIKAKVDSPKVKTRPINADDIANLGNLKLEDPDEMDNKVFRRYIDDLIRDMGMRVPYASPISFSADGKTLTSGSFYDGVNDKGITRWNLENGKLIKFKEVGLTSISNSLSLCSDGKKLASATDNYDIKTHRLLKRFIGHTQHVNSVSFSPDCKLLASGSADKTIRFWDVANGRLLKSLDGHTASVTSISFSPDGKTLASGGNDGKVQLWDVAKRTWLKTFISGANGNWYSVDAQTNVVRGDDGSVFVSKAGKYWKSTLPQLAKPIANNQISISGIPQTLELNSGQTTELTLTVTNHSDQTLYWLQAKTPATSHFIIYPNQIYQLKPGESQALKIEVGAELPSNVKPLTDNLVLNLSAPQLSEADEISYKIPVNIHAPQLEVKVQMLIDRKTIKITVKNQGNQEMPKNWLWQATVNGNKLDEQSVSDQIPAQGKKELSYTLPEQMPLIKINKLDLRIHNTQPPFYDWEIKSQTIQLYGVLGLLLYAIAALFLLLIGFGIYYLRGYRHPLVLQLSQQPEALLQLLPEQLSEAKTLLKKTRRLDTVLAAAGVSAETLDKAITFSDLSNDEQAALLIQRVAKKQRNRCSYEGLELYEILLLNSFPLRVYDIWLCFCKNTAAEDMLTKLKNIDQIKGCIIVLIGKNSDYQHSLVKITRDLTNNLVAPQGVQLTRLLLADAETELAKIFAEQLSLRDLSPYQIGGGVDKEVGFFGRTDLVAQILNRDPANYLLVGARKVGKSTVLKAIERRLQKNPHVDCFYIQLTTNEVIVPRISSALNLPTTEDPIILAASIRQLWQQHGRRLWLLIDEVDPFFECEKANGYLVLSVFRSLSEEGICNFIFAGFWALYQHAVLDYHSPVRNFGEVLTLGALEYEACIELVTIPMAYLGISYADKSLIETLISQCGQRANLIAMVCDELVKGLPFDQREVSASNVTRALHLDKLRNELSAREFGIQEHEQQYDRVVIFATITRTDFTLAELSQLLEDQGFNVDLNELTRTLSRLELAFILGQEQGRWSYRVPLFVEFARQQDPKARLVNDLKTWGINSK